MYLKQKIWEDFLPHSLPEVWAFFSRPENLERLTPGHVSFELLSDIANVEMYPGMLIQYRISPFLGIRMNWVTEITQIEHHRFFIDEQRFGPYAFWHHQHHFEEKDGGVLMRDILHYRIPFGPLGKLADALFVDRMIEGIFAYRKEAIKQLELPA